MYRGRRVALSLFCYTFVATGLVVAALGPALPELARQTQRPLAQMGAIFVALFGGGLVAQLASGAIADRFGRRVILVTASALFGGGALAMSLSTQLSVMLVFATIFGLGYGGLSLSVNVLSSELTPHRRASTVNLVNVFFGLGAIAGPLFSGLALEWWGTPRPALQTGAVLALLVAPIAAFVALPTVHHRPSDDGPDDLDSGAGAAANAHATATAVSAARTNEAARSTAFVWASAVLLLLYAGTESAVGSWMPVYLRRTTTLDPAQAATITSAFWASLCAGRVLAVIIGLRLSAERLLTGSFVAALVGAALLLAGHGTVAITVFALCVLGLAFGPLYPTVMAVVTAAYPQKAGAAASLLGAGASIGGMILPAAHGVLLTHVGAWTSPAMTLVTAAVMLLGWLALHHQQQR